MKPTEPIDIMVGCCLPDRKRLLEALAAVPPGGTIQIKIENSAAVKVMVENVLKNTRAGIVKIQVLLSLWGTRSERGVTPKNANFC